MNEKIMTEAVEAIEETIHDGWTFEGALEHYAELFGVSQSDLRHEWNLLKEDCK